MISAFAFGVCEFRSCVTRHYDDLRQADAYDWGREWANRLTFRWWDE